MSNTTVGLIILQNMLGYVTPLSPIFHGCFLAFQKEAKHVSFDSSAIAFLSGSFPHVPHHFWNIVNNCGLYTCSSFICLVNIVLLLSLLCATHCTRCWRCGNELNTALSPGAHSFLKKTDRIGRTIQHKVQTGVSECQDDAYTKS